MQLVLHHSKRITSSVFSFLKKRWYIALILVVVIGYFIYKARASASAETVQTYTVKSETIRDILALSGDIDASEKADLHFQSGGRLVWVGVKEGDTVKKNQGIASLDQRQLQSTLQKYLNTFSKERNAFDQSAQDYKTGENAISQDLRDAAKRTLDNSQADLNNAVLDVELQTVAKEYSYLYTPIDGVVTRIDAPNPGTNVSVTDTYEVINPASFYFALSADQTEVVKLSEGMKGKITLDPFPDKSVDGVITSIGYTPKTNETGTVYEVKMNFSDGENTAYRLGMTGDVEFILHELKNVVAIPIEYIIDENDKQYVMKKVNNKQEKVEIKTGDEDDSLVQVTDGLQVGDVIYETTK